MPDTDNSRSDIEFKVVLNRPSKLFDDFNTKLEVNSELNTEIDCRLGNGSKRLWHWELH